MTKCILCNGTGIKQVARDLSYREPSEELKYQKQLDKSQMQLNNSGLRCSYCKGSGVINLEN